MPRLFVIRVFRALLAVWFVLSVGEPSVVHICPMHASAAAELAEAGIGDTAMAHGSREMAHHAARHAGHGSSTDSHSSGQHQHHCTCISCCVGSATSILAATPPRLVTPPVVTVAARRVTRADLLALEDPPHLLPPGTGPPRAERGESLPRAPLVQESMTTGT